MISSRFALLAALGALLCHDVDAVAWELPDTLTLTEAVERGLAHDPAVAAARAVAEAARAATREATADWFPTLSLMASATRYEEPMIVTPIHGFTPGATPPFDRTLVQGSANLSFTLFDGGGRSSRIRRSRSEAAAARAGLDAAQQSLAARVVAAYLEALSREELLAARDRGLDALKSELDRVQRLRTVGRAADVEVLRVEAVLAAANADRVETATALDLARRDLARLIGATSQEIAELEPVALARVDLPSRDTLWGRVLGASPRIEQARRDLVAAEALAGSARSARWPHLDLFGAYVDRGSADGDFTAEWNVGVQVTYPVFTGGRISGAIERADALSERAREELRARETKLAAELDRALSAIEAAGSRVRSLATAVARSAEVARIERLRLETGTGTQTDYLRAEADLLAARAGWIEARHAEMRAHVEIARLGGRLDLEWVHDVLEGGNE